MGNTYSSLSKLFIALLTHKVIPHLAQELFSVHSTVMFRNYVKELGVMLMKFKNNECKESEWKQG